ncbi:hypothetical protein KUTeg_006243 [Tegillarca granosa]|uniref:Uncharacterized protein n=1 Tax=Tegillarca granosa TaxID=220873 RepID=A0ABQ9FG05_TEGGR|nr:hypothetical protein KUTeg_006243 [Tegillarca granosa]
MFVLSPPVREPDLHNLYSRVLVSSLVTLTKRHDRLFYPCCRILDGSCENNLRHNGDYLTSGYKSGQHTTKPIAYTWKMYKSFPD